MKINAKRFRVPPGAKVRLAKWPTLIQPLCKTKEEYEDLLNKTRDELSTLQKLHYAPDRYALLLILQGMDSAGKDGVIAHVMSGVNPQGAMSPVSNNRVPKSCSMIFSGARHAGFPNADGSGSLIARTTRKCWWFVCIPSFSATKGFPMSCVTRKPSGRTATVRSWIRRDHLYRNRTRTVKIFLHLSKEEQRKRFLARLDDPQKNWKFSLADIHERKYWKDYMTAYEACLGATSTRYAPWYVVPADDKKNARLIISRILLMRSRTSS